MLSAEKRKQLWLSDLCVKYGELSMTPSSTSLSSTGYSATESATDFEIDQLLLGNNDDLQSESSWMDSEDEGTTASSYEYYWSKSNTG